MVLTNNVKMRRFTKEEQNLYLESSKEVANINFGIDPVNDLWLEIECFSELNQEGLPILRAYKDVYGGKYYMIICTDEQLCYMRIRCSESTPLSTIIEPYDSGTPTETEITLGSVNLFYTESGVHSYRPIEDVDTDMYLKCRLYFGGVVRHTEPMIEDNKCVTIQKGEKYKMNRKDEYSYMVLRPL